MTRYGATIVMIFLLFSTLTVSKQKTFWVFCIFSVDTREIHSCVLGFILLATDEL